MVKKSQIPSLPSLLFVNSLFLACAAGPHDTLGGGGPVVHAEAGAPQAYSYVARKPLIAVGLADARGVSEEEAHAAIDRLAEAASACLRSRPNVTSGAARIALPIDPGGITGAPDVTFSPEGAAPIGMLCVLAPLRLSSFSPASADAGERSLTVESAWGPQ